jgi:hypothetical protein
VREHHFFPSLSEQNTEETLLTLRRFRASAFSEFSYEPTVKAVVGSSHSSFATHQAVTNRLSSIFDDLQPTIHVEKDQAFKQIILASTFEGTEKIENYLALRDAAATSEVADYIRIDSLLSFVMAPALTTLYTAAHLEFGLGGLPSDLFFAQFFRHLPERVGRHWGFYDYRRTSEKRLRKALNYMSPGAWLYQSSNDRLPEKVVERLRITGELTIHDLANYSYVNGYPRVTVKMTGRNLTFPKLDPESEHVQIWVRVDEALFWEDQPVLTTVVRLSQSLPPYPILAPAQGFLRMPFIKKAAASN